MAMTEGSSYSLYTHRYSAKKTKNTFSFSSKYSMTDILLIFPRRKNTKNDCEVLVLKTLLGLSNSLLRKVSKIC